jgi:hypothetical protein
MYICGSKQGSRCIELECAYECRRHLEFSGIRWNKGLRNKIGLYLDFPRIN